MWTGGNKCSGDRVGTGEVMGDGDKFWGVGLGRDECCLRVTLSFSVYPMPPKPVLLSGTCTQTHTHT